MIKKYLLYIFSVTMVSYLFLIKNNYTNTKKRLSNNYIESFYSI